MISVVIPAYNEPYLQQTIDDIFESFKEDVEVIAVLDGYWPDPPLREQNGLIILHQGKRKGMRGSINAGARIAKGEYLMKCDAHCAFAEGFDKVIKNDLRIDWTIVPARYELDPVKWKPGKKCVDFEYIEKNTMKGRKWRDYAKRHPDTKIQGLMTSQGSCWIMYTERFWWYGGLDEKNYGSMGREAQEVCLKTWLSGGKYLLNQNTWYAHWSKPGRQVIPKMKEEKQKSMDYCSKYYMDMNIDYPKKKRNIEWLVRRFDPVPTWGDLAELNIDKRFNPERKRGAVKIKGFNRGNFANLLNEFGFKIGAEIGVKQGKYSEQLCKTIPGLKLYSIDPWVSYKLNPRAPSNDLHNKYYAIAKKRLSKYDVIIIKKYSIDALNDVKDESLDFVYIDGNHMFDFAMVDIIEWSKKVRTGGIVSGHDYYKFKNGGVKEAVDFYTKMHKIKTFYVTDEKTPTWFWVKDEHKNS